MNNFQTLMTCADVSGPESLLRGPDRKKTGPASSQSKRRTLS